MPTELRYVERSVFMKEVSTQNLRTFDIGTQEGINVAICKYCKFSTEGKTKFTKFKQWFFF